MHTTTSLWMQKGFGYALFVSFEEAREVLRAHLDHNKWKDAAINTEQLRSVRWMVGSQPKGNTCPAELRRVLCVTPQSQVLHLKLVVHLFGEQSRRLRASARSRVRLSSDQFDDFFADFACMYSMVLTEARQLSTWNAEKEETLMKSFFQRDYKADVEAIVTSKLATWKLQHFGLWHDLVAPVTSPVPETSAAEVMDLEEQAHQAKYRELRAKIAQDLSTMTAFNAKSDENDRRSHVVSVMHERAQVQIGKELLGYARLCESFMEKSCRVMLSTEKNSLDAGMTGLLKNLAVSKKAWKSGQSPMDKCTPRYKAQPPAEDMPKAMERPQLKVCQVVNGNLVLPSEGALG
ncbi:unnamed protein product [Durusdinium trenchii]|uniref:Uncharacterized protein n=1 Tax=Durusdinium trenchii TaxID=1381693 RepID=A0ABP0MNZ8_9DINO